MLDGIEQPSGGGHTDSAPTATEVTIKGKLEIGETLTASYKYTDLDRDRKASTIIQSYADGKAIEGATSLTFVLTEAEQGKKLTVKVTPKNAYATGQNNRKCSYGRSGHASISEKRSNHR